MKLSKFPAKSHHHAGSLAAVAKVDTPRHDLRRNSRLERFAHHFFEVSLGSHSHYPSTCRPGEKLKQTIQLDRRPSIVRGTARYYIPIDKSVSRVPMFWLNQHCINQTFEEDFQIPTFSVRRWTPYGEYILTTDNSRLWPDLFTVARAVPLRPSTVPFVFQRAFGVARITARDRDVHLGSEVIQTKVKKCRSYPPLWL